MIHSFAIAPNAVSLLPSSSAAADAFGRVRVGNPETIFEIQSQYGANITRMENGSSGADAVTPAWSSSTRLVGMQVNAGATGGTSFTQSFSYVPYQVSDGQLVVIEGLFGTGTAGAVKRFGLGDAANGIFLEQNGTAGLQINQRTSTSGVAVNNLTTQPNWNIDKFDGTGPSGVTLDITKMFELIIDFQNSVGRVRIGFVVNGLLYYAHAFSAANTLALPYTQSMCLPLLAEIVASPLASAATSFLKSAAVVNEGGLEIGIGRQFSVQGSVTAVSGTRTHILSIRPLTTFGGVPNRAFFSLQSLEFVAGANPVYYELVVGAAFTVLPTYASVNATYSAFEAGTAGTFANLTNGIVIQSGYLTSSTGQNRTAEFRDLSISYPISLNRAGAVRDLGTLSLLLSGIGGNSICQAAFNWSEIR